MKILNNKYLKIFLLLGVAYIISYFSIKNIFLAESPRVNPFFVQNLIADASNFWNKSTSFFAFKNTVPANNNFSNNYPTQAWAASSPIIATNLNNAPKDVISALSAPLNKISQGVYAGEKNDYKVFEVKTGELEYLEYTFNVNGKEVKIKVPKGQDPPSQNVVNEIYK
jgi:hypothetical protein